MAHHFSTQIFDSFPHGVYTCDREGRITYYNKMAVELWGKEPVMDNDDDRYCASYKLYSLDGQFIPRDKLPVLDTHKCGAVVRDLKAIVERPNGSKIVVLINVSPINDGNQETIGSVNIFQDITQQHGLERDLQEKNHELKWTTEELEQMVYCVSHDLREPLRVASTYIQLLSQKYSTQLDDRANNYITTAIKSCERVRDLINDFLKFSRVRGEYSSFQMVDLNKVLSQALLSLKVVIDERHAVVTSDDLPYVFADEAKVSLVFQNLISNAIKFCKHQPKVHIFNKNNENNVVTIGIKDNGIGIDPSNKGRIFEIFQRLHSSSEYAGTGMGLAICKKVIEQHQGKIWFHSEIDKGAVFYFTLCGRQSSQKKDIVGPSGNSSLNPLRVGSSSKHVVQIYEDAKQYYQNLILFTATGLENNEAVIILATLGHWEILRDSLTRKGFDTEHLIAEGRINFIDAQNLYTELMKDGEDLFVHNFSIVGQELITRTIGKFTKFRAFGELVDVLCANGRMHTAVEVEKAWHQFVQKYNFALFCAYTAENLNNTTDTSHVVSICKSHTHLLFE